MAQFAQQQVFRPLRTGRVLPSGAERLAYDCKPKCHQRKNDKGKDELGRQQDAAAASEEEIKQQAIERDGKNAHPAVEQYRSGEDRRKQQIKAEETASTLQADKRKETKTDQDSGRAVLHKQRLPRR